MRLLDHIVVLFLNFYGSSIVSTVTVPFSMPIDSGEGFPWQGFLPPIFVIFCLFDKIHSKKWEIMCHCGFWFQFSWWLVILSTFHTSVRHLSVFLWEIFILLMELKIFLILIFQSSYLVLLLSFKNSLYIVDINHLSAMCFTKIFPITLVAFHSVGSSFYDTDFLVCCNPTCLFLLFAFGS